MSHGNRLTKIRCQRLFKQATTTLNSFDPFRLEVQIKAGLSKRKIQARVVILREIRPEYAIPVGVWQVREGIREAMNQTPLVADDFENALLLASNKMSISKNEWLAHGNILGLMRQKTLSDFF